MTDNQPVKTQRDERPAVVSELSASGFDDAEEIGRGGFGIVYRCRQPALDRTVAVKVLTSGIDFEEHRDRFLREQRAMGRLTGHPNIVSVLQVGQTASGYPYLVMQFHRHGSLDTLPGRDLDGFRRSHLDAATTQRLLTRLTSPQQVAHYEDIALVALITADSTRADEFVRDTLGDLLTSDADIRETVATYAREQFNTSRTAERLYTHRNTVIRRLARADELMPRPLAQRPVAVAAALEVLRWRGEH